MPYGKHVLNIPRIYSVEKDQFHPADPCGKKPTFPCHVWLQRINNTIFVLAMSPRFIFNSIIFLYGFSFRESKLSNRVSIVITHSTWCKLRRGGWGRKRACAPPGIIIHVSYTPRDVKAEYIDWVPMLFSILLGLSGNTLGCSDPKSFGPRKFRSHTFTWTPTC